MLCPWRSTLLVCCPGAVVFEPHVSSVLAAGSGNIDTQSMANRSNGMNGWVDQCVDACVDLDRCLQYYGYHIKILAY